MLILYVNSFKTATSCFQLPAWASLCSKKTPPVYFDRTDAHLSPSATQTHPVCCWSSYVIKALSYYCECFPLNEDLTLYNHNCCLRLSNIVECFRLFYWWIMSKWGGGNWLTDHSPEGVELQEDVELFHHSCRQPCRWKPTEHRFVPWCQHGRRGQSCIDPFPVSLLGL